MTKKQANEFKTLSFKDKTKFMGQVAIMRRDNWHLAALVPWLKNEGKELFVYYVFSLPHKVRLLSIELDASHPHMESIIEIYLNANSFELEAKELFGIWFDGNPNMRKRLFLPEDFKGIPFKEKKRDEKEMAAPFFKCKEVEEDA